QKQSEILRLAQNDSSRHFREKSSAKNSGRGCRATKFRRKGSTLRSAITQTEEDRLETITRHFRLAYFGSANGGLKPEIYASSRSDRRADVSTRRNLYQCGHREASCSLVSKLARERGLPLCRSW